MLMRYVTPDKALDYADYIFYFTFASLLYIIFLYFYNKITNNLRGQIEFKNDLKALLVNIIFFVLLISAWSGLNALANNSSNNDGLVGLGSSSIDKLLVLTKQAYSLNNDLIPYFAVASSISSSASFAIYMVNLGGSYGFSGYSIALDKLNQFNANLFSHILSLSTLKTLLYDLNYFAIMFFLPVGVMFRAFPLTRRLGSTMIAISIGVGIMLPVSAYFASDIITTMLQDPNVLGYTNFLSQASQRIGDFTAFKVMITTLYLLVGGIYTLAGNVTPIMYLLDLATILPIIGQISMAGFSAIDLIAKGVVFGFVVGFLKAISGPIADVVYSSDYFIYMAQAILSLNVGLLLFYFTVSFATLSAIRSISIALGGEFFLYGVSGLI